MTRLWWWPSSPQRHGWGWRRVTTMSLRRPSMRFPAWIVTGTPRQRGESMDVSSLKYVSVVESSATPSTSR